MLLADNEIKTREVTHWRGLHLLHYDLSSCSQKVRILIGELGIEYTSHPVNLMRGEQRTEWYLGINARGEVPVLVHNGEVHIESNDIIEYLDRHFAKDGQSLLPVTDAEQHQMRKFMALEDQLHPDLRTLTFTYLAPAPGDHAQGGVDDNLGCISRFHDACVLLDDTLRHQPYLLGDRMTLADITWFITLHRLGLASYPLHHHPDLRAYVERLRQRPTFRQQVTAGPLAIRLAGLAYRHLNRVFRKSLPRDYERWRNSAPQTSP